MDPNGDITDTFDDEELANTIESGQKGPWNDGSAIFEDPKVAELKQEMDGTKSRDYQQRRLRELQERTAKAAATPAPKTQTAPAHEWGESASSWDEESVSNDPADKLGWGGSDAAETANEPTATTPPGRQHASANPKSLPAKAAKPATNYTVAAIVAVAVIAAAAFAFAFGLFGG